MVGMSDAAYWASWYLTTLLIYIVPLLISVAIVIGTDVLFVHANYGIVFFLYLFYALSIIPIGFIVSIFCNKVKRSGAL